MGNGEYETGGRRRQAKGLSASRPHKIAEGDWEGLRMAERSLEGVGEVVCFFIGVTWLRDGFEATEGSQEMACGHSE